MNVTSITAPLPIWSGSSNVMYCAGLSGLARADAPTLARRLLGMADSGGALPSLLAAHELGVFERARAAVHERIAAGGTLDPEKLIERVARAADLGPDAIVSAVAEVAPIDDRADALEIARQYLSDYRGTSRERASRAAARWNTEHFSPLEIAA